MVSMPSDVFKSDQPSETPAPNRVRLTLLYAFVPAPIDTDQSAKKLYRLFLGKTDFLCQPDGVSPGFWAIHFAFEHFLADLSVGRLAVDHAKAIHASQFIAALYDLERNPCTVDW